MSAFFTTMLPLSKSLHGFVKPTFVIAICHPHYRNAVDVIDVKRDHHAERLLASDHDLCPFVTRLLTHSDVPQCDRDALAGLRGRVDEIATNRNVKAWDRDDRYVHMVISGLVAQTGQTQSGKRHIPATYLPGEIINLGSIVFPERDRNFIAIRNSVLLAVSIAQIRDIVVGSIPIRDALWREFQRQTLMIERAALHNSGRSSDTRLSYFLCDMAERLGVAQEGVVEFNLGMTHEQLADATGLTSVHVCRTLKALRTCGLAVVRSGHVCIADWATFMHRCAYQPYPT